jgi:hypothetical protein
MSLAAAALALALAQAPAPNPALEKAGWTLITASEDVYVFMRAAPAGEGGLRRAWTAYDAASPRQRDGFTFRSVESLSEFDCKRRLTRVVEEIYHDGPALGGQAWRSPTFIITPWAAPEAGSVGAIRMAFACKALSDT